jgi:hypothetical protein
MGWRLRLTAILVMLIFLGLGVWPVSLLVFLYLAYSFRRPRTRAVLGQRQETFQKPARPWGRYGIGAALFLLSFVAAESGGTYSPEVFLVTGLAVILWPVISGLGLLSGVVPVKDSVLLQNRLFPLSWHALAEVKLESQDQTRGIAAMSGKLLLFAGRAPAMFQVVSVCALNYRQAEASIVKRLRRETKMLSQRGAHLLPADSADAADKLSLEWERLSIGTEDFEAVSSLPFDAVVFQVKDGRLVSHRAFNVLEPNGTAAVPVADLKHAREPLFAEVVQEIGRKHGWPAPDEFSSFLASLDASRTEPLVDRFRMKEEVEGKVIVETPGSAQVRLTKAQVRALARIYA